MRVFIVDDERIIREGLCRMVRRLGEDWSVVGTAANGCDAIDQMPKIGPVDLLITDVRMPVMNGLQLISKIRDQWPSMNIIVLSGYNDFEYIRHALLNRVSDYLLKPIKNEDLVATLEKIQREWKLELQQGLIDKKRKKALNDQITLNLLEGYNYDWEAVIAHLEEVTGDSTSSYYWHVLLLSIDEQSAGKASWSQTDRKRWSLVLKMIVDECLESVVKFYAVEIEIGLITVLIAHRKDQVGHPEDVEVLARSLSKHLMEQINHHISITVTIGVSLFCGEVEELPQAYRQAHVAISSRLFLGGNRIIEYKTIQMKEKRQNQEHAVSDISTGIMESIEMGNQHALEQELLDFLKKFNELSFYEYDEIINTVFRMLLQVQMMTGELGIHTQDLLDKNWSTLFAELRSQQTLDHIKDWLEHLLIAISQEVNRKRNEIKPGLIFPAIKYIEKNAFGNIKLLDVANVVYMSPTYFSEVFKLQMGIKFIDYVVQVRIRKSMELLRHTHDKVYEIAEQVGYKTPQHFTKVFHDIVGVTPVEYRKKYS